MTAMIFWARYPWNSFVVAELVRFFVRLAILRVLIASFMYSTDDETTIVVVVTNAEFFAAQVVRHLGEVRAAVESKSFLERCSLAQSTSRSFHCSIAWRKKG